MIQLSHRDFFIAQGTRGKILSTKVGGICLVMFYSPNCEYCKHFLPSFDHLSRSINGCKFAILNVNSNKPIIGMSKSTIIPITYVPYIILYVDGKPFMRYDGPKDVNEIKKFIAHTTRQFSIRNKFSTNQPKGKVQIDQNTTIDDTKENEIPAYTIGIPKTGTKQNVCYFTYEDAYGSSKGGNVPQNQKFANPGVAAKKAAAGKCYHCYDDAYGKK